jgi:acyl carrier protein
VKIRGFRIEPAEIEAVLNQHSGVQAVVLAREDVPGDRRLVAYLVAQEKVAEGEWRAYLSKRLPQHMIPSFFVQLDEFPLTSNGKIDRRTLPTPEQSWSERKYVGPRTPLEEQLAQIWAEVLGLERAGVLDNFFDLGGHSLKATQIISRTQRALGVVLPLRSLFEHPTVADLAHAIEYILEQQKGENFTAFQPISSAIYPAQLVAYLEDLPAEDLQELLAATNPEFED